jgi:hypothetical protein
MSLLVPTLTKEFFMSTLQFGSAHAQARLLRQSQGVVQAYKIMVGIYGREAKPLVFFLLTGCMPH